MIVLDTDLLSLLERGNADSIPLQMKLAQVSANEIATTIITYEEQMRGWLARAAQANTKEKLLAAYSRLQKHIVTFQGIPILPFDEKSYLEFERLQKSRLRLGSMDLKIAAIALANNALLITRNLVDFNKVPGLQVADWSI